MQLLRLVALAGGAPGDELPHQSCGMWVVEGRPEPMECLLDALVPGVVCCCQDLWPQCRRLRHEDATIVEDEPVDQGPSQRRCPLHNVVLHRGDVRQVLGFASELVVEHECRRGEVLC
jgi:hypothetical protein